MKKLIGGGFSCITFVLIFNLLVGGWSVEVILDMIFHKTIPFIWATVIGLFTAEVTVPVAIILWILRNCGVL